MSILYPDCAIATPALLIDQAMMQHNIAKMADIGRQLGVAIRPHTKTHKCPQISRLLVQAGAVGICSATLSEAEVMAEYGLSNILITRMVVGSAKIKRLLALSRQITVAVVTDSLVNAEELAAHAEAEKTMLTVLIELNVGNDRCGMEPNSEALLQVAQFISQSPWLIFGGLQGYAGHTPLMSDPELKKIAVDSADQLGLGSKLMLEEHGIEVPALTGGASGTCMQTGVSGYTELQPGSYVTMDSEYSKIVGDLFMPALTMLTTVISKPSPQWVIVDAGGKSLSVDHGPATVKGWPNLHYHFVGDEYGKIEDINGEPVPFNIGDQIELFPSHGCTTINLHDCLHIMRDQQLEFVWPVAARGRVQ